MACPLSTVARASLVFACLGRIPWTSHKQGLRAQSSPPGHLDALIRSHCLQPFLIEVTC